MTSQSIKFLMVTIAALTLAACGNAKAKWKNPAEAASANKPTEATTEQRLHQERARLAEQGERATSKSIEGTWCSIDPSVGKVRVFGKNGEFTLIKADGTEKKAKYSFDSKGNLVIAGNIVEATVAEADGNLGKVLSLTNTSNEVELMEPCDLDGDDSEEEGKESKESKEDKEPKEETVPEFPKQDLPPAPPST